MVAFIGILSTILGSMVFLICYALTDFTEWHIPFAIGFGFSILYFSITLINGYYEIKICKHKDFIKQESGSGKQ